MEPFDLNPFGDAVSGREFPAPAEEGAQICVLSGTPVICPATGTEETGSPAVSARSEGGQEEAEGGAPVSREKAEPVFPAAGPVEGGPDYDPCLAHVRFLHAVTDGGPLRVALENRLITPRLAPGSLTGRFAVRPGFRTLALFDARSPFTLLYLGPVPFSPGEIVTLAVVRSANRGVDLVRVDDRACYMRGTGRACVRAVNLIYDSPALDVMLTDGRVVFTDLRFKETTACRRARAGQYDMYAARTPRFCTACADIETVEDLPAAAGCLPSGGGVMEPLASFGLEARPGATETICFMGDWTLSRRFHVRVVENC